MLLYLLMCAYVPQTSDITILQDFDPLLPIQKAVIALWAIAPTSSKYIQRGRGRCLCRLLIVIGQILTRKVFRPRYFFPVISFHNTIVTIRRGYAPSYISRSLHYRAFQDKGLLLN